MFRKIPNLAVAFLIASCTHFDAIEIPIRKAEGSIEVPFSIAAPGTYDIELEFPKNAAERFRILHDGILQRVAGTATLRCEGKILKVELPTGWVRLWGQPSNLLIGEVIVRFRAEATKTYFLSLEIKHLPSELRAGKAIVIIRKVGPHFHPGHHVFVLH
jgi:hypothetical protein